MNKKEINKTNDEQDESNERNNESSLSENMSEEKNENLSGSEEGGEMRTDSKEKMVNEKDAQIKKLEIEIADLKDKLLRKAAEFENYKRRSENDQLNLLKYAAEPVILKILSIVDDFERSLLHIGNSKDVSAIKAGIQLIYDKLIKTLNEQGVEKIDSVGKPFNVDYHDALMQKPVQGVEPHTVVDEIEKGYKYKDRVIRHAKVIVSSEPTIETAESSSKKSSRHYKDKSGSEENPQNGNE
jgi:molecular chaperone GrpE